MILSIKHGGKHGHLMYTVEYIGDSSWVKQASGGMTHQVRPIDGPNLANQGYSYNRGNVRSNR